MKNMFKSIVLVVLCLFIGLLGSTKVKADLVRRPPGNPAIWEKEAVDLQWGMVYEGETRSEKPYVVYKFTGEDAFDYMLAFAANQEMNITVCDRNGIVIDQRRVLITDEHEKHPKEELWNFYNEDIMPTVMYETAFTGRYYVIISTSDNKENKKRGDFLLCPSTPGKLNFILRLSKYEIPYTGKNIRVNGKLYYTSKKDKYIGNIKGPNKVVYSSLGKRGTERRDQKSIKNIGRYYVQSCKYGNAWTIVTITPPKGMIASVKSKNKNKLEIQTKMIPQVTGCEVQVATDPEFTKNVKTYRMKLKKTISGLESSQKYYVRVRFYKIFTNYIYNSSKIGQKDKIYGPWGKRVSVYCK